MTYRAHVHGSITCTPNLIMLGGEVALPLDTVAGSHANINITLLHYSLKQLLDIISGFIMESQFILEFN